MSEERDPQRTAATGPEAAGKSGDGLREILTGVLLGLASVAVAWCSCESGLWGGIQLFRLASSGEAGRKASERSIAAAQRRAMDAWIFERYTSAWMDGKTQFTEFLHKRMRPELRAAIDAWVALKPLENPDAPITPALMPGYSIPAEQEAQKFGEAEAKARAEAEHANGLGDRYLMLTVVFSLVLFLTGTANSFRGRRLRVGLLGFSALVFLAAATFLMFLPLAAG